jgi:hypothetical protein
MSGRAARPKTVGEPRDPSPPANGGESVYQEGAHTAPGRGGSPGVPGKTPTAIHLPPLSPSAPVRTQVFQPGRPQRTGAGCGIQASGGGTGPHGHAGERRLPQGGSLPESQRQAWSATIHPQDSSSAGDQTAPGLQLSRTAPSAATARPPEGRPQLLYNTCPETLAPRARDRSFCRRGLSGGSAPPGAAHRCGRRPPSGDEPGQARRLALVAPITRKKIQQAGKKM